MSGLRDMAAESSANGWGTVVLLTEYAQIIGETYAVYISVDGGRCEITGYPLTDMWSPVLRSAFVDFMEVANPQGVFVVFEGAYGRCLLNRSLLNTPHTTIVRIDPDQPTAAWRFIHMGEGFLQFGEYQPRVVGGFSSAPVAEGLCRSYEELLAIGKPGVCRIAGLDGSGATTMYDRLWLPIAEAGGAVAAFMTIADITLGLTLPDGRMVGGPDRRPKGRNAEAGADHLSASPRFR